MTDVLAIFAISAVAGGIIATGIAAGGIALDALRDHRTRFHSDIGGDLS